MPTVAQKLCHDIVEPVLKQSSTDADIIKSTTKVKSPLNIKQNPKFSRVYVENKSSNKIKTVPDGTTITKSKTSIFKKLAETGVNTLVSGSLKCDNNCVTLVRKRALQTCKCGQRRKNVKESSKSIQTLNKIKYSLTDKAVANCVETITCGTQFIRKSNSIYRFGNEINSNIYLKLFGGTRDKINARIVSAQCPHTAKEAFQNKFNNTINSRLPTLRYVGAKQWALSHYPTRGPDF